MVTEIQQAEIYSYDFDFCGICGEAPYMPDHRCSEVDLQDIDDAHERAARESILYHSLQSYDPSALVQLNATQRR